MLLALFFFGTFFSLLFLSFLALYFAVYFGLDSNFSTKYSKVYSGYNFCSIIHQGCFERERAIDKITTRRKYNEKNVCILSYVLVLFKTHMLIDYMSLSMGISVNACLARSILLGTGEVFFSQSHSAPAQCWKCFFFSIGMHVSYTNPLLCRSLNTGNKAKKCREKMVSTLNVKGEFFCVENENLMVYLYYISHDWQALHLPITE